jgi:hypothetical protein
LCKLGLVSVLSGVFGRWAHCLSLEWFPMVSFGLAILLSATLTSSSQRPPPQSSGPFSR